MVATLPMKLIHREFLRFLLVGATNTGLSYLVYVLLLRFFSYLVAYSIAYCLGIVLSYFLNVYFVFKQTASFSSFLTFPMVYLFQYGLGAAVLWLLVEQLGVSPKLGMAGVIMLTIPVTFLTSRYILRRNNSAC